MPNYEYRCLNCRKRFEKFLTYSQYGSVTVTCPYCSSENVQRKVGRIRIARSDESRMDDFSDPSGLDGLEDNPRELGRMMRKMSGELGEDMGPEFNEVGPARGRPVAGADRTRFTRFGQRRPRWWP